ncbi:hypothetical protein LMF89_22590 [Pelosinus sp. Bkl1]|uniref:Amino acid transporter n=1 Tax=Pelosinus baikalensis TaxID=2892015 RepID=A0ABS8I0L7_9FIRM|nr:hypothetical protein [Pelosinus baikalensis]
MITIVCLGVSLCIGVREGVLEPISLNTEFIRTVLTIFAKCVLAVAMSMMTAVMTSVQCVVYQPMLH